MSDYQFGIYEGARVQERKLEKQSNNFLTASRDTL